MEPKKNYALPIVMMFALFFMIAFVTNLQSPLGVIVKEQFALDTFRSQWGTFANFLAYACMGIPAGAMLRRYGYRRTALTAVVVGFAGVGVTLLSGRGEGSFPLYLAGAFVSGFSMCMLNTVVNPMLNTLGGGGRRGNQLIQFGGVCNSVGGTLAPVLGGYLMGNAVGGRVISTADPVFFLAMGIFALTFLVLFRARIPEPFVVNEPRRGERTGALSFRHFRLGVAAIFVYVGVEVGIPSIANFYMTGTGAGALDMDTAVAGTIVGTYWFLMLVGRLAGGLLGGRVSSRPMLAATASLGLVLVVLGMYLSPETGVRMPVFRGGTSLSFGMETVPVGLMCFVLCGLCTSVMWGAIFNLAVEGLGKYTPMASGIFMTMVVGGGVLPALQGWIADMTDYATSYWLIFGCLLYILYYALAGSRNVNRTAPVAE
ncbi:MFS transporter [uncultured Alistipes sp.]|jgi:fucose permease|uniref:MFS transporter n=1 Tax=Alistipes sp. TaxID=1872444 RepID=UPI00266B5160|nr:MFS transporter [uncultured Alistipes sp.]